MGANEGRQRIRIEEEAAQPEEYLAELIYDPAGNSDYRNISRAVPAYN